MNTEVNIFKCKLKLAALNNTKIMQLKDELTQVNNDIIGISSPSMKEVIIENGSDPYHTDSKLLALIKRKDTIQANLKALESESQYVELVIGLMNEQAQETLRNVYFNNKTYTQEADRIGYSVISTKRIIDKEIKSSIKMFDTIKKAKL